MTIEEAHRCYILETRPTPSVRSAVQSSWPKFAAYCQAEGLTLLSELRPCHIEGFQKALLWQTNALGQYYSPNSVDQFMRRVRQLLRWAVAGKHIAKDPTHCLLLPRPPQPAPRLFTWAELQTVFAAADLSRPDGLRDAVLLRLLTETDLGLSLVLGLQLGQETQLELEPTTRSLIDAYLQKGRPQLLPPVGQKTLLLNSWGTPFSKESTTVRLRLLGKLAGLKGLTSRLLRRSYQAHLERSSQNRHSSFNRDP